MEKKDTAEVFAEYFVKDGDLKEVFKNLYQKMTEGHLCIEFNPENVHDAAKEELKKLIQVLGNENEKHSLPFVIFNSKLYTSRMFHYETQIVDKLKKKLENNGGVLTNDESLKKHIQKISGVSGGDVDWQLVAALNACARRFSIITGGPGTGKTTTLAKILSILYKVNPNVKIELAAPTGKAKNRMKESLQNTVKRSKDNKGDDVLGIEELVDKIQPKTIHKLLGAVYQSPFFKHNSQNTINADVVVIDESSMMSAPIFAKLLDALDDNTTLILLGDSNQLPPVESGNVFSDLCASCGHENKFPNDILNRIKVFVNNLNEHEHKFEDTARVSLLDGHVVRLLKNYRYTEGDTIDILTKSINKGDVEKVENYIQNQDHSLIIDTNSETKYLNEFADKYWNYIMKDDTEAALEELNKTRILVAVRESKKGLYHTNKQIESILAKKAKDTKNSEKFNPSAVDFYHNQPIMVTKNIEELDLFNGDVGIVRVEEGKKMAYFPCPGTENEYGKIDGKNLKKVNPGLIAEWETVFAMTIHKSQGSEFDNVLIILPSNAENPLLTRELVYTAITRGRNKGRIVVQTTEEVLRKAVERSIERISGIKERLN